MTNELSNLGLSCVRTDQAETKVQGRLGTPAFCRVCTKALANLPVVRERCAAALLLYQTCLWEQNNNWHEIGSGALAKEEQHQRQSSALAYATHLQLLPLIDTGVRASTYRTYDMQLWQCLDTCYNTNRLFLKHRVKWVRKIVRSTETENVHSSSSLLWNQPTTTRLAQTRNLSHLIRLMS